MQGTQPTIPEGYKQTDVGIIPEDWNVKKLGDVFDISAGGDFVPNLSSEIEDGKHPYPIYSNSTSNGGLYGYSSYFVYAPNAITVTARGTLGVANFRNHRFTAIGRVLVLHPKSPTDCFFVSEFINNRIEFVIESTGVPQLTAPQISSYQVPVPPLPEQQAIAEVLSDVDALVTSLDRLIAKKRNLKQGAMPLLLTGKKRLAGFSGEWETEKLGSICKITTGKKDVNEGNPDGIYPFFTCSREYTFSDVYSFDTEAILIAGNGDVGTLHYYNGKFEAYQRTYVLDKFQVDTQYLFQYLGNYLIQSLVTDKIGSSIPYIKLGNLKEFRIYKPRETKEVEAIARILSDMDTEIEALEKRREKYKAIKQGMMQELLTGKTRLI